MSLKRVIIKDIGEVTLYKKKVARGLRISISHSGKIRLTMPKWTPYAIGVQFINKNRKWIKSQPINKYIINDGDKIGLIHTIKFISSAQDEKIKTRVSKTIISVCYPSVYLSDSPIVQETAIKAATRALKKQSSTHLVNKLNELANNHNFKYKTIRIKQMSSRWGSCNRYGEIVLNCYLVQLPVDLIEYVIFHELVHTKILAHGNKFWKELGCYVPDLPEKRRRIKLYKPVLTPIRHTHNN